MTKRRARESNMKWYLILTVAIIELVLNTESKHWALVVAGSSGWYNYRHQVKKY